MSDPAPAMTPADIMQLNGAQVTVIGPDGKQIRAVVVAHQVKFSRIDVTTKNKWLETGEREYIDGRTMATITVEVLL